MTKKKNVVDLFISEMKLFKLSPMSQRKYLKLKLIFTLRKRKQDQRERETDRKKLI